MALLKSTSCGNRIVHDDDGDDDDDDDDDDDGKT